MIAPVLGCVIGVVALAGCAAGAPAPTPNAASLVEQRTQAAMRARTALDGVIAAVGGRLLGRAWHDACYAGQHNWKVDDGYANRCTIREVAVFGFSGDFRRRIALLDSRLFRSGWALCSACTRKETLSWLVNDYWDMRVSEATREHPFSISRLPAPGPPYERGGLMLTFSYGGRDMGGRSNLEFAGLIPRETIDVSYERTRPLDVEGALSRAHADEHVLAAEMEVDYFQN